LQHDVFGTLHLRQEEIFLPRRLLSMRDERPERRHTLLWDAVQSAHRTQQEQRESESKSTGKCVNAFHQTTRWGNKSDMVLHIARVSMLNAIMEQHKHTVRHHSGMLSSNAHPQLTRFHNLVQKSSPPTFQLKKPAQTSNELSSAPQNSSLSSSRRSTPTRKSPSSAS
jgi:hypothetical protein